MLDEALHKSPCGLDGLLQRRLFSIIDFNS